MKFAYNQALSKWSRIILLLWGISICVVAYLSLMPEVEFPLDFWNADKLYHCLAYGWLAVLPMIGFTVRRTALSAALSMIVLGAILETGQYFIPGRMFSFLDFIANCIGVSLGIILGHYLKNHWRDADV